MSTTMLSSTAAFSPDRSTSKEAEVKRQDSPANTKATDETCSTTNCDDVDSLTASTSANMTQVRLYGPPVGSVNVDKRNVRQRLRDQEAKINALLYSKPTAAAAVPDASEGVLLKLVKTLEEELKKSNGEKQELQDALEKLQRLQEEDKTEEEVEESAPQSEDVMAERMSQLEVELTRKTHEASLLQDRWETTLRRMVQYQVDLETHDLHYTDYAAQQFLAGQETLVELKDLTRKDQPPANRQLGKKAKHMMSTLLKDLEVLGERYKDSRVNQEQQVADLRIAQMEWQRRAEYLEARCKELDLDVGTEEATKQSTMSGPLMKFHQKLRLQQTAAMQTHEDLHAQAQASQQQTEQAQLERDVLEKEVERLQQKVAQLSNTTQQQQDALHAAQQAAANAFAAAAAPKKKKGLFRKPRKSPPRPRPPQLPKVDVAAALAPLQGESKRFDMLHERMQAQSSALQSMQQEYKLVARQKSQLHQTVTDLRMEQEQDKAANENQALQALQLQMEQLEAKRAQEQEQAQATIDQLRRQLEAKSEVEA